MKFNHFEKKTGQCHYPNTQWIFPGGYHATEPLIQKPNPEELHWPNWIVCWTCLVFGRVFFVLEPRKIAPNHTMCPRVFLGQTQIRTNFAVLESLQTCHEFQIGWGSNLHQISPNPWPSRSKQIREASIVLVSLKGRVSSTNITHFLSSSRFFSIC